MQSNRNNTDTEGGGGGVGQTIKSRSQAIYNSTA